MTSLSFAIMAHQSRLGRAVELVTRLPAALTTTLHLADAASRDVWGTAQRAWEAAPACDWHIVVQDDAVLADDFVEAARAALTARGDENCVVSFFSFAKSTVHPPGTWLELTGNTLYAVALAIPTRLVSSMLLWTEMNEKRGEATLGWGTSPKTRHDDKRILDWCKASKIPAYVTCPNIVDHDPGPSIANPGSRPRVSANFMRNGAAQLDWTNLKAIKVSK